MLWFFVGFIVAVVVLLLVSWLKNKNIKLVWYEWVIGIVGLLLILAAIQHYAGALREGFAKAALLGSLSFGIPAIVLFVVVWQLISRRRRAQT
ncbi:MULTISPECIES: hypothetical protein [Dehalococcoides]|jgi:uncharacterized membrane protein|uniref:Reductive dehalogenase anchoring protein n=1 Tax=Dehalococcoides mccartyi TaxID=61435 RepID=A0A142VC29_9CHLR|nr:MULTISPECIES: hypothetical protein [Dehalococcoides]AGG07024.1 putative reductive dehalogenase anchoring protein [Dehalococcoides mccartyi DCMB5]AMU87229.1 reductive dehalogenase anchoring protein [Dehalococcoides mccartyi]PKH45599.1 hypothetical protein KKB3_00998 [Dehalococcoides mccartyi]RAL70149.1 Tetrachloroethene reductive dehalogenase TceA membrane-bound subunit [Dehalococcoides mccartyi]BAS32449.1 reductive dehalogenase anchoring protein [Dehalococcoides mccartyi IBARAKI]